MKRNLPQRLGYFLVIGFVATLTLSTSACLGMSAYTPPSGVTLSSINVTMASNSSLANALRVFFDIFNPSIKEYTDYPAQMKVGSKEQFIAIGTYSDTAYTAITPQVTWTSSDTSVATISSGGLVTGVGVGITDITATFSGITSPAEILTVVSLTSTTPTTSTAIPQS